MNLCVIDCSVTMAWCFPDEHSDYAVGVLNLVEHSNVIAPALWLYEVANVLTVGVRRGRISQRDSNDFLDLVRSLDIVIAPVPEYHEITRIIELSSTLGVSAYDATYVDLACEKRLPLATLDHALLRVAGSVGCPIFRP